jgi:pyridoxamine 5'-phosphate oxidase family protein
MGEEETQFALARFFALACPLTQQADNHTISMDMQCQGAERVQKDSETCQQSRGKTMSRFTPAEIAYLQSQRLGRLATVNQKGDLHVVPVGFRYNPEQDTIDIGGHNIVPTKKYRDAVRHGRVAFVVDDVLPPWKPRMVEVRGTVQALPEGGKEIMKDFSPEILRITPTHIVSIGIDDDIVQPSQGRVQYHSRKVE